MLVDLLGLAVLLEKASEDAHATHPGDLLGETSVGCTLALTEAGVTTLAPLFGVLPCASLGVDGNWLANDQTIVDQSADVLSYFQFKKKLSYTCFQSMVLNLEYDLLISNLQVAFQLELFRWPTEKCDTYKSGALSLLICKPDEKS